MSDLAYAPVRPAVLRTVAEAVAFVRPGRHAALPSLPLGCGRPVLVLPVIGRGDGHTSWFRATLGSLGHATHGWGLGLNPGPTPRVLEGLERRLTAIAGDRGPVDVVGFSLGGVFARFLAHRHPFAVRQVVTVCSPFRAVLDSAVVPLRPLLRAWGGVGLADLAEEVSRPLPVPGTFLFGRSDGIVAWRSCVEPDLPGDCFEIAGRHVGIATDPDVLSIVARRLVRFDGPV